MRGKRKDWSKDDGMQKDGEMSRIGKRCRKGKVRRKIDSQVPVMKGEMGEVDEVR